MIGAMTTPSRWSLSTPSSGSRYAERFAALAAAGNDVHGEASLCASLLPIGARVLDAGCGTGRVAIRLAELGYDCVGIDSDHSMLATAQAASTDVRWLLADLANINTSNEIGHDFDLVVAAGNVMPLLAPDTEADVIAGLAERLKPGGLLVAGFGLDAAHLPLDEPPFGLAEYDAWCTSAGLELEQRFATWSATDYDGGGYAVSIHRRSLPEGRPVKSDLPRP
jgi:SAM-dependent methyltransferase